MRDRVAARAAWLAVLLLACGPRGGAGPPAAVRAETASPASSGETTGAAGSNVGADAELEARARRLLHRARQVEPSVTPLLRRMAQRAGGDMVGLEHRFKTLESTLRKMRLALAREPALAAETVLIQDALRYTMRIDDAPPGTHVRAVAETLDALEAAGHRVVLVKNYWPTGDNYSGVNTVLEAPDGLPWELQFHTTDSYRVQGETRAEYEELRLSTTPVERRRQLFDRMTEAWDRVPLPEEILEPGNLHGTESIRERDRP